VEVNVDTAVARRQRPDSTAREVADDLDLEPIGRLVADDLRAGLQVVRELPLELLAGFAADAGCAVGLDGDVDRSPPLRIGAGVGERLEDGLSGSVDIPLVDEDVLGRHGGRSLSAGAGAARWGRALGRKATPPVGVGEAEDVA